MELRNQSILCYYLDGNKQRTSFTNEQVMDVLDNYIYEWESKRCVLRFYFSPFKRPVSIYFVSMNYTYEDNRVTYDLVVKSRNRNQPPIGIIFRLYCIFKEYTRANYAEEGYGFGFNFMMSNEEEEWIQGFGPKFGGKRGTKNKKKLNLNKSISKANVM